MKALVSAVVVGVIAYVIWFSLISAGGKDDKYLSIQIGYGNLRDEQIEMHTNVGVAMVAMDNKDEIGKIKSLDDWVTDHFKMIDSAGKPVRMERQNHSKVIKPHQVIGTQEFFLVSKLKPGESYTCDYKPRHKEPDIFRYTFVAPSKPEKPVTVNFMWVK